ncbi:MAG: phosphoribosylanthranilate isomerase [Chloroflexota bacterium]|nr:phosphoribosylanthranilate isomerase [Chloroflexota bacterium]
MTLFKICGLKDSQNALVARENGASFLGFVFVHGVRREVSLDLAIRIIDEYRYESGRGGPALVGLFANQPIEEVNEIISECGLDYAQLCGEEDKSYWDEVDAEVIKQVKIDFGVNSKLINSDLDNIFGSGYIPLLDKYEKGTLGGTGKTFDWNVIGQFNLSGKFILAGGLTSKNVSQAIRVSQPWAVDVSTGVETDGAKDESKIFAFAAAVNDVKS